MQLPLSELVKPDIVMRGWIDLEWAPRQTVGFQWKCMRLVPLLLPWSCERRASWDGETLGTPAGCCGAWALQILG